MAVEKLDLEVAVEGFRGFLRKQSQMDDAIEKTGNKWGGLGRLAKGAAGILAGVGVAAFAAVAAAAIAASVAIVKIGLDSLEMASDFQSALVDVQLAAKDTGLSVDELGEAALKVGADTSLVGVSASGAAEAMSGLFKAGLTGVEVFGDLNGFMNETAELGGALRASIDLAAASELDMVAASELAAITLASFGGELETAEERSEFVNFALNNLVQTADASVASVGDLAAALVNVGPVAQAGGFSIQEVNAALGILSSRGITGAEAGTALKSMLLNITRPTDAVTATLTRLGVKLFDSTGTMKDMRTIIGDLEGSLSGLTQEQRNAAVVTLAGSFGQSAMNSLLAEGVEGWDEMTEATANASTIQEIAAAKTDTYAGKLEALEGVVETLKIRIGQELLPIAEDLAEWAAVFAEENGPALQAIFERIAEFIKENLPPVLEFLVDVFSQRLPEAIETTSSFWTETLWPAIQTVVAFIQENVVPIFELLVQWFTLLIPVAIQTVKHEWEFILLPMLTKLQSEYEEKIAPALEELAAWLRVRVPQAIEILKSFWENVLLPAITVVWAFIRENVLPILFDVAAFLIKNIPVAIDAAARFVRDTLIPALTEVWAFIQDNVIPILVTVGEWLGEKIPKVLAVLAEHWEQRLLPTIQLVWAFIQDNVIPLFQILWEFFVLKMNVQIEAMAFLWETRLQPALAAIWEFIKIFVVPILEDLWKKIVEKVMPGVEGMKLFLDELRGALDFVAEAIQGVIGWVQGLIDKMRGVEDAIPDILKPGSPPPFAFALRDIADEMQRLSQVEMPALKVGFQAVGAGALAGGSTVPGLAGSSSSTSVQNNNEGDSFHLTTQSSVRAGGLADEFAFMEMGSR